MPPLHTPDHPRWIDRWLSLPDPLREVYYHPAYAAACGLWERARAVNVDLPAGLYPVLLHPIEGEEGLCDAQTPYGYGGPVWDGILDPALLAQAGEALRQAGAVAEFMRVHPHHLPPGLLTEAGFTLFQVRTNIECDLAGEDFTLGWSSGARRNLRKARGAGLDWRRGASTADWDAFERLYTATAARLEMSGFYRFDRRYFDNLAAIPGVELVIVEGPMGMVAAAIVFVSGQVAHYHLGGSDFAHQQHRPNDLLYFAMASVAREAGCARIVWGGGLSNDPADSLLRFKSHFGAIRTPVYGAGRVLDRPRFDQLCQRWQQRHPGREARMFLKYRA